MRRPGPDEWKRLITQYETSGLVQKAFCDKHDGVWSRWQSMTEAIAAVSNGGVLVWETEV